MIRLPRPIPNILTLACLALAACQPSTPSGKAPQPAQAPTADAAAASGTPVQTADPDAPVALKVTTTEGAEFDVAAHRGKWLVVNFWATWCHPCLAEMPALSKMDATRKDMEVLGLAYDDIAPDALKTFLKSHPVDYPVALVDVYHPPAAFPPPEGLPTTYLLDPAGKVAKRFVGPVTPEEIEGVVDAAAGSTKGAMR